MSRRPRLMLAGFGAGLTVLLAALGGVSLLAVRLERARADAVREAAQEENVRLALWRMDAALSPWLGAERARPDSVYHDSAALAEVSPHVRLYFRFEPGGTLASPQAQEQGPSNRGDDFSRRLSELRGLVSRDELRSALATQDWNPVHPPPALVAANHDDRRSLSQSARNEIEWRNRAEQNADTNRQMLNAGPPRPSAADVDMHWLKPVWIKGELLLARTINAAGGEEIDGGWLDAPEIERWLHGEIEDLLPGARLRPIITSAGREPGRMLAALPFRLDPGALRAPAPESSPLRMMLILVWVSALLAAAAVAALLVGAVALSERRAAFVAAVTHELRTPLTTFRMYTEMLADGMVPDEDKRRGYLQTLRSEAERLGHLIENVLSYSRLEQGRAAREFRAVTLEELLERNLRLLSELAGRAGMSLTVKSDPAALSTRVLVDASAVDRILFNLVDNACKYARPGVEPTIDIELGRATDTALVRVRDHGPGIDRAQLRRLFRPFSKSAQAAADSAPGIGLGLALSRRLARSMGGNLSLEANSPPGACFVLSLPMEK